MRFHAKNFARSVLTHPKENLIILFNLIVSTMVIFVLIQNYYYLKERHDVVFFEDRVANLYDIHCEDDMHAIAESDIYSKTSLYDIGLKIYDEINSSGFKTFSSVYSEIPVPSFDEETRTKMREAHHSIGMIPKYMLSEYALDGMGLKISEGRWFNKEEIDHPFDCERVPVVLGSDFKDAFDIGDVLVSNARGLYDEAEVIGFLESNSILEYYKITEGGFNGAIILGSAADFPRETEDPRFGPPANRERIRTLLSGFLYCPDESVDVQKEINRYTSKYGFYQLTVTPIDGTAFSETRSISERNLLLIGVLAVSTTVICMVSLGGVLYNRTLDDRRTYCIYMSAGIPLWKINLSLILEMLFWMVISIIPVIALSIYEFQTLMIPLWQIALFEFIVMAVSIAPSLRVNSKCNLDLLIRDQTN